MNEIETTLQQRGSIYGDYNSGCKLRGAMLDLMMAEYSVNNGGAAMPSIDREHILDILNKLIRIAVSPKHIDSWHDIQGYAKLTETALREQQDD